jgi:hypothetical protein
MTSSKLFRFLSSLNSEELRSFRKFLESPYFNTNEILINLFDWLRPYHPTFKNAKLTKENCFIKLYPDGKKYSPAKVNDNLSKLTKLTEEFLAHETLKNDGKKFNLALIESLSKRQLFGDFEKLAQKLVLPVKDINITDWQEHYEQIFLMLHYYHHPEAQQSEFNGDYLKKAAYHIDEFYNLLKLRVGYEMLSGNIIKGEATELDLPLSLQKIISSQKESSNLKITILIDLISTHFHSNPEEILNKVIEKFLIKPNPMTEKDRLLTFINILNQVIILNRRNVISRTKLFNLYQIGLKGGYFLINDKIPDLTYTNIATLFCAEKLDEAETFIEGYRIFIPYERQDVAYTYAKGCLHYFRGDFYQCIQTLKDVKFPKRFYHNRVKSIIIRSWFEMFMSGHNVYISLKSQIETFDRFLRRKNDVNPDVTEGYLNFLSLLKKTIKLKMENKLEENKDDLIKRIKLSSPMMLREWFIKKLTEDTDN